MKSGEISFGGTLKSRWGDAKSRWGTLTLDEGTRPQRPPYNLSTNYTQFLNCRGDAFPHRELASRHRDLASLHLDFSVPLSRIEC